MFYLEIFEFNFCGLNKNTRRNIQERERKEMLLQKRNDNSRTQSSMTELIEISPDYIIHNDFNTKSYDENTQSDLFEPNSENGIII